MHEQHSSNGSLSLAVSLLWSEESVSLENTEQVLLPVTSQHNRHAECSDHLNVMIVKASQSQHVSQLTRVHPETQTSHGRETVDGGLSQSHQPIWGPLAGYPAPGQTHLGDMRLLHSMIWLIVYCFELS